MKRWRATSSACLAIVIATSARSALPAPAVESKAFPTRPIRVIVAASAGTAQDILARVVGQGLTDIYKEQVVVENRAGAGGLIGGAIAAHATPDGYTLFMAGTATYVSPLTQLKPSYHPVRDFTAVAQFTTVTNVVLVAPAVPAKSVRELVAFAKSKPGALNYGSVGVGTGAHLAAEIFKRAAGIDVVHVPFRGVADVYPELVSNQVHFVLFTLPASLGFLRDGKVRALAVTSRQRSPSLPGVQTVAEAGLPGAESESWFGVLAPTKTPRALVNKLSADIVSVLRKPQTRTRFASLGAQPPTVDTTPEAFGKFARAEYENYRKLITEIGLKPQ